jgi:high-affinity nickel-transport protein
MSSLRLRITEKIPMKLRILPFPAIRIISILIILNIIIWIGAGIILHYNPSLTTPALLSYTLGLRHALDADHISAIDLMTRRLVASGDKPVTVGTWFSLGHSTIVIITCIVVAATAGALEARFGGFKEVGGIIGTSVSAAVLLILGFGNAWILYRLVKKLQQMLKEEVDEDGREGIEKGLGLDGAGFLVKLFKRVFQFIDRPWKMYPLGVLFGLGFDTSSEVAVLGIASVQGASGTSIWLILIFPVLFTGTCSSIKSDPSYACWLMVSSFDHSLAFIFLLSRPSVSLSITSH